MLRKLVREKWTYIGLVLLGAGAILLTGCASGVKFSFEQTGDVQPGNLFSETGKVAKVVGGITGMPWLDTVGGILTSLGGAAAITKAVVNSHDKKPFTKEDADSIDAARAGGSKPVA